MRRLLRFGLLWILAVAMPLQGMAAATIMGCASEHHAAAASAIPAHEAPAVQQAHHLHHAGSTTTNHASMDGPTADAPADGTDTQPHTGGHSCSACAACCASFALLSAPLTVAAPGLAAGVCSGSTPRSASTVEHAPERPPRALRA